MMGSHLSFSQSVATASCTDELRGKHLLIMCVCQADERRPHVEVCAEGGVVVQQLARRIVEDGGAALIADYGHDGTKTDTFRVRHKTFILLRNQTNENDRVWINR